MGSADYAILVGIGRYPELGEDDTPLDLKGPENDVEAVRKWLTAADGGNLPDSPRHIQIVGTPPAGAPISVEGAKPTITELERAIEALDKIADENSKLGFGRTVGRRLYIYMSGHGFSPGRQRGCLYAANARERAGHNIHASGWLAWLQDAAYFREYVLWMDCCMNRVSFFPPRDPPLVLMNASDVPGATFIAFAAQRPLKAVEVSFPEDGNKWHGIFTWTLLEGLKGAAADTNGRVTGRSLADWIRNAQAARLTAADLADVDVAKEPEVVAEDPTLVFARGVAPPLYDIGLSFGEDAVGRRVRLWSGMPPSIEKELMIPAGAVDLALRPGLYVAEVPSIGIRQGFEVLGPMKLSIGEAGAPVDAQPGHVFQLDIDPNEDTAEIYVIDSRFALVDGMPTRLQTPLPFGIYKIKVRLGRSTNSKVILLDRDGPSLEPEAVAPPLATAAPLAETAATHEWQVAAAHRATERARELWLSQKKPVLIVMARVWSGHERSAGGTEPWEGVTVVSSNGRTVLDLARDGERGNGGDPYAFHSKSISPGTYFLRLRLDGGIYVEQSLVVAEKWGLEVQILRRAARSGDGLDSRPRISVHMPGLGSLERRDRQLRLIETARIALADERRILSTDLHGLLVEKFDNPMCGIIGGHLLLLENERDSGRDLLVLNEVVGNLRRMLGTEHPDVEALSLRCPDSSLRRTKPLKALPMFERSWRILAGANPAQASLIPRRLWRRVLARASLPPYLVWAVNEEVKAEAQAELARAMWMPTRPSPNDEVGSPSTTIEASDLIMEAAPAALDVSVPAGALGGTTPDATGSVASKVARERARRIHVPMSALKILKEEYLTVPNSKAALEKTENFASPSLLLAK